MTFTLPDLPYTFDALEPHIDKETMEIHHDKHHAAYIKKLNAALEIHPDLQNKDVNELIKDLDNVPEDIRGAVQSHGGGHSNHSFWWPMLKKDTEFKGDIADAITSKFGSIDDFKKQFTETAMSVFGSGWAWLVLSNGELEIMKTPNQDSPLMEGKIPLLGVDMWEHSFYKKWGPDKPSYLEAFFNVINWEQVNKNFQEAKQ